jgi:hypothetical protein
MPEQVGARLELASRLIALDRCADRMRHSLHELRVGSVEPAFATAVGGEHAPKPVL